MEIIKEQINQILDQLEQQCKYESGDVLIVGCSTSEVQKMKIGTSSSKEIGEVIFNTIYEWCKKRELYVGAQCCEHLNRAIVVEKSYQKEHRLCEVNVVPQIKAGGSFATAAYENMDNPVVVEHIKAQMGIDIGDTLIGMHLQEVAVPVRTSVNRIGDAHVVCARTRPKFIGGQRARYNEDLL